MKQSNRTTQAQTNLNSQTGKPSGSFRSRHQMNRFLRRFLIFVLFILMAASLLAGYATLYPVTFGWNTAVLNYHRDSSIIYQVLLKNNEFTEQNTLGMDQQYLRDFAESVNADFEYRFYADQPEKLQYSYQIDANVRVHDINDPAHILLNRQINLLPATEGEITGADLSFKESVTLNLAQFESYVKSYTAQSSQPAAFDLMVTMSVRITAALPGGPVVITDEPKLLIPLVQPQFQMTRVLPDSTVQTVIQPVVYRLVLAQIPFWIYPAIAGICLLLIILLLTLTSSRRKNRFNQRLRRMIHQARNRLMLISDKAWEPEFCVTVADYKSLIRTAKKLKHPVFCYIDHESASPAAYFYIYYGENNYCYTFADPSAASLAPDQDDFPDDTDDDDYQDPTDEGTPPSDDGRIPLLPETDENSEILMSSLRMQTSFSLF